MITDKIGNWDNWGGKQIRMSWKHLVDFIEYIGTQYTDLTGDPPDLSKYLEAEYFTKQKILMGHEMLHVWGNYDKHSYAPNGKYSLDECMVRCLEKRCFDPESKFNFSECDKADQLPPDCRPAPTPPPESSNDDTGTAATTTSSDNERSKEASDDNFSFSSGMYLFSSLLSAIDTLPVNMAQEFFSFTYYPDILIYDKFSYPDLPTLLEKDIDSNYMNDYTHDCFSTNHKLLIIPSGELMGEENSGIIKQALEQFVASGGTLLVLAQQYNTHFENLVPVPEGETLKAYGWRQDQSCYNGAVYFDTLHPVVCSSTSGLVTATNDGYFDAWPSTATVLLNRTKNREGALLYYPYGENGGHVILTSLYTDWGYAHSQATSAEIKIIRDLITFAKNPNLPIPMYNLEENANPDITLDVVVKNTTDSPAGKVKVIVSDPNREIILYESEETCIN